MDRPDPASLRAAIARLATVAERSAGDFQSLHDRLTAVPVAERDLEWRMTVVELDAVFGRRGRRTFRAVRRIRDELTEAGRAVEYDAWWAHLTRLVEPRQLMAKGYFRPLRALDEAEVWSALAEALSELRDVGLEPFLVSGTLLGVVRDGGLIGHDNDLDLAVILDADGDEEAAREWARVRRMLSGRGLLDEQYDQRGEVHTKLALRIPSTDLFPAWRRGEEIAIWPHTPATSATRVLPLQRRSVHGAHVLLPADPESSLVGNYGPDWRTPDPLWTFDWEAARERFATFVDHWEHVAPRPPHVVLDRDADLRRPGITWA